MGSQCSGLPPAPHCPLTGSERVGGGSGLPPRAGGMEQQLLALGVREAVSRLLCDFNISFLSRSNFFSIGTWLSVPTLPDRRKQFFLWTPCVTVAPKKDVFHFGPLASSAHHHCSTSVLNFSKKSAFNLH